MIKSLIQVLVISLLLLTSCKSKKNVPTKNSKTTSKIGRIDSDNQVKNTPKVTEATVLKPTPKNATYSEIVAIYIENYNDIAKEEMKEFGIPASITLAQGILESGAGRGTLSRNSNNHFGIKCHKGWKGERVYHDDDELQECFRKYKDPRTSFKDHSLFLSQRSRYSDLFTYKQDDYKSWARGLKKAGYATDPKYPQKLINIIDRYKLYLYDEEVLGKKSNTKDSNNSRYDTYTVVKGDTLYSISKTHHISVEDLKKYNNLATNTISIGQELYLEKTKD